MDRLSKRLKKDYYRGLEEYLLYKEESGLTYAYEMGRRAVQKGVSELDLITYHHDKLIELENADINLEYEKKVKRASVYLKECLAPFEVKLGSYRNAIEKLEEKNEKLNQEITNRREVEKELFQSKEYFQSLIENAQDIITVIDVNGVIRYSSPSIERILGYEPPELVGKDAFQYVHKNNRQEVKELFKTLMASSTDTITTEFRFKHKSDHWIYLESIATFVENSPDGSQIIINSRDVTERNRAVRQLQEHKIQLAEAQQIAKVGSWQWNPENGQVKWSNEMCRIFGLKPKEFDNTFSTFANFIDPADIDQFESRLKKSLKEKESFSIEHKIIRNDGAKRTLLCRGHIITDRNDDIIKMIGTGQDITEQKKKEQRLQDYSERLRNLSEKIERAREEERIRISRQVHDELGQMLTVLKMDVSMMKSNLEADLSDEKMEDFKPQTQKILDLINVIIKSVQQITTELRPEVLDDLGLKEALDWQAKKFAKHTGVEVDFSSNVEQTSFLNDKQTTTLFRIFQETLTNIIRHAQASKVTIELQKKTKKLYLIVKDNGIGITPTEKESPSSLGIIGMRERTQFLGGDVSIRGEKGKGTKVTLCIPIDGNK